MIITISRLAAMLCLLIAASASSHNSPNSKDRNEEHTMTQHARGTFDVKLVPLTDADRPSPIGRMSNDKQFHGDIEGSSVGQMLMLGTAVQGSAAYVSIEIVTGKVHGRAGSFALQHNGVMTRGEGRMTVTIVPDSGTDALTGIAGTFAIRIDKGVHAYDLEYTLPEAQ